MKPWNTLWRAFIGGQVGPLTRCTLGPLLTVLTFLYDWAHQLRLQMYRRNWRSVKHLPCRVISVGNLTLGGTGKTPIVEAICSLLQQEGIKVGILSRGYGGTSRAGVTIISDGENCILSPDIAGDEPVLLAEHLPGVPVIVGIDRYASGMLAVERFGVDVVVLDDGFQHVRLARDLDLLLLDSAQPFGNGRVFPHGNLRERPAGLARAHAIVLTHWDPENLEPTRELNISARTQRLFYSQHEPLDIRVLTDGRILPLTSIKGRRVMAFCGIGAPERFRQTLHHLEATVVACKAFPDHHPFTRAELGSLLEEAKRCEADLLVTTEKDGIRLRKYRSLPMHLWEVRVRATIAAHRDIWKACIVGGVRSKG